MANVTTTPNMGLNLPIPTVEVGPAWAFENNTAFTLVDGHDHSSGKGVQISPLGINISSDLPFGSNNATLLRTTRYTPQVAALSAAADIGCLYVVGNELYYNDVTGGHQIAITSNGSVTGSSGTITGLPSGTAGAAFSAGSGTFIFTQATSTAANLDIGTIILRYPGSYPTPSGNYIAFQAPSSLATGFAYTWPNGLPGSSGAFLTSSSTGTLSYTNVDNSTIVISSAMLKIPSNVNLLGKSVQENGNNIAVSNTNATNSLAIIRVYFGGTGSVNSGEGASCVQTSTGQYTVTFDTAFADRPAISVVVDQNANARIPTVNTIGTGSCKVYIWNLSGGTVQESFLFIAIGQRA